MTIYTETNLKGPFGRGSSHKQMYDIPEEPEFCFVAIPKSEEKNFDQELKNYKILETYGVRIPIIGEKQDIVINEKQFVGVKMEKLKGVEYKQTLTWVFVKKQINTWNSNKEQKIQRLIETIKAFLNSEVMVTDLQVFILDETGEMVVFDPSTAGRQQTKPTYSELNHILSELQKLI